MRNVFLAGLLFFLCSACHINGGEHINASGRVVTENRDLRGFSELEASGPIDVTLSQGDSFKVEVEADDNLMPYIETRREGNELRVGLRENISIRNAKSLKVKIQMPQVDGVRVSGSGSIRTTGRITNNNQVKMGIGGSGDLVIAVKSPEVEVSIGGSGKAVVNGETRDLEVSIGGSGDFLGEHLLSEHGKVSIGGSGTVKLHASVELDVSIAGSGDVFYLGSPNIKKSIIGSGDVKPLQKQ